MQSHIGSETKLFTLQEARDLLPLIQAITKKHQAELSPIQDRLNRLLSNDPRRNMVEQDYEKMVGQWINKIEKLGAQVFGLWVVQFDVGNGLLCWKHPELLLNYFRHYDADFASRTRLADVIQEQDPDWAY